MEKIYIVKIERDSKGMVYQFISNTGARFTIEELIELIEKESISYSKVKQSIS
ncbi:hypothetical protein EDC19_0129 [Natranaerovirga hydrolytica]|uniref:Uncharacterized protein n=1 Tax=Natranaerovirga hydrolytica TaxID=680378 RepID=A0A4R1MWW3_9FIRM|nr:hypothetical protein [Natranaerovirga hydrolytica]TCK97727.1 hypothetical protein EDC19_0129 [Natranaerovirga hydrolytica]